MKKRQATKKLSLNKQTIANLNKQHMNSIVGGNDPSPSNGINNQNICDDKLSKKYPKLCPTDLPLTTICNDKTKINCPG
ncbi:MAG: class I lanthipeptide [Bacteroidales bacterium]|nr:class I lanthipeptide [Bacteroidales bacterium]